MSTSSTDLRHALGAEIDRRRIDLRQRLPWELKRELAQALGIDWDRLEWPLYELRRARGLTKRPAAVVKKEPEREGRRKRVEPLREAFQGDVWERIAEAAADRRSSDG